MKIPEGPSVTIFFMLPDTPRRPLVDRSRGAPEPIASLNAVRELENGEPLVDMRIVAPEIRILRPQTIPYCRETVAHMAVKAAAALPKGFSLGLIEAWRPLERQRRIYDFFMSAAQAAFPHRDYRALRRTVCRWVAPVDQKAPPGHCTGGALDVFLLDPSGEVVDVSAPWDRYLAAPTFTRGLTHEAERMRFVLHDAMIGAGFTNCRDEWWHYSYGDAAWAVRLGRKECCYGWIHMPLGQYREAEALHEESMRDRPNPFLPNAT